MCVQDIRIARNYQSYSEAANLGSGGQSPTIKADGTRRVIIINMWTPIDTTGILPVEPVVTLDVIVGGAVIQLASLSPGKRTYVIDYDDYGGIMTGAISVRNRGGISADYSLITNSLIIPLEAIEDGRD